MLLAAAEGSRDPLSWRDGLRPAREASERRRQQDRSIRPQASPEPGTCVRWPVDTLFLTKNGARALLPIIVAAVMDSEACLLSSAIAA